MKNKVVLTIIITVISLILVDQLIKCVLQYYYEEPIEKGILTIEMVKNDGIAFSINSGNTKNIVLTVIVLLIVINFIRNQKDRIDETTLIALGLILAGGISNLIDRIVHGGVIDFIKIEDFSVFNIADCYVVIGWILIIINFIKINKELIGEKKCEK